MTTLTRSDFAAGAGALALAAACATPPYRSLSASPPNILVFIADDASLTISRCLPDWTVDQA
jgi:hypothetical protein